MRVEYLRYFNHLAKVKNYTKAAKDLYIAQPTLSVAIKRMENELGLQLFVRGEGVTKVELTPEGEVLQEYVEQMINSFDTGLRIAHEMQGEANSEIRVGTIYAMQGKFWSQAMQDFSQSQRVVPNIVIEQAYSAALVSRLKKGELDVIFATKTEDSDELNHILVWSQPLVLGVHKDNPLAKRKSITVKELMKYEILTYSKESPANKSLEANLLVDEMNLRREYDDEITLSAMVSSNKKKMALFCYSFLVNAFEDVVCLTIKDVPIDFHKVYLISRRETHPKVVDQFISFMSGYRFPNPLSFSESLIRRFN